MDKKNLTENEILDWFKIREAELKCIYRNVQKQLRDGVEGKLWVSYVRGYPRFYICDSKKGKHYSKKENSSLHKNLSQKEYCEQIEKLLKHKLDILNTFLKDYPPMDEKEIYEQFTSPKKEFIEPLLDSDNLYLKKWLEVQYESKQFLPDDPVHFTSRNIRVRSKSEVLIADELDAKGIPFRYEFPIKSNGVVLHPDFYCLDIIHHRELIWEHFGLMDNEQYVSEMIQKLYKYASLGFFPGKNLIMTFENAKFPLNKQLIKQNIEIYFS